MTGYEAVVQRSANHATGVLKVGCPLGGPGPTSPLLLVIMCAILSMCMGSFLSFYSSVCCRIALMIC